MVSLSPSVSVVIPTFNRGDIVVNAIESALNQTYKDHEIIVVDDGSNDNTRDRLRSYLGRIRYFYQDNRGASSAQQKGVQLAKGEWISILGSDDTWLPDKLDCQMRTLSTMGREFGACFTNCSLVGDPSRAGTTFCEAGFKTDKEMGPLDKPVKWVLARYPILWAQSLLVKRKLMLGSDGFDSRLFVGEDTDLLFRLSFSTKFCFVSRPLVNIDIAPDRVNRLSELYTTGDERAFISGELMYRKWIRFLKQKPDVSLQEAVDDLLIDLYYRWAKETWKRSEWSKFFLVAEKLNRHGKYGKVLKLLLSSGVRKLRLITTPTFRSSVSG